MPALVLWGIIIVSTMFVLTGNILLSIVAPIVVAFILFCLAVFITNPLVLMVIGGFLIYGIYEYLTMDSDISKFVQENKSVTIGELLQAKGFSIDNYEDCKFITCLTYRRIESMGESGELHLIDDNPLTVQTKIKLKSEVAD
jgi:hypothetical protein